MNDKTINYTTTKKALYELMSRIRDEGADVVVRRQNGDGWQVKIYVNVTRIGMDKKLQESFDRAADMKW